MSAAIFKRVGFSHWGEEQPPRGEIGSNLMVAAREALNHETGIGPWYVATDSTDKSQFIDLLDHEDIASAVCELRDLYLDHESDIMWLHVRNAMGETRMVRVLREWDPIYTAQVERNDEPGACQEGGAL